MIEGNAGTTLLDAARGWPTPVRADGERGPSSVYPRGNHGLVQGWTPDSAHWPTPDAAVSNDGEDPETFLARKEHHATRTDREPTRAGVPLALAVKWATPAARDGKGAFEGHTKGGRDLSNDAATWATPTTPGGGAATRSGARGDELLLPGQAAAWATPRATEGEKGGPNGRDGSGSAHLASQAATWPTPVANDGKGPQPVERPEGDDSLSTRVARIKPGLVLNPVFVEALMGWPLGWTDPLRPSGPSVPFPPPPKGDWGTYLASYPGTEPAVPKVERAADDGAPRTDRLRACGNGVVPGQAAAAIGELLGALGVSDGRDGQVQVVQGGSTEQSQDLRCVQDQVARGASQGSRSDEPRHALPRQELRTLLEVHPAPSLRARRREDVRGLRQGRLCLRGADTNASTEADAVNTPAPRASVRGWRNRWRST